MASPSCIFKALGSAICATRGRLVWPLHHNRKSGPSDYGYRVQPQNKSRSLCKLTLGNNQSLSSSNFLTNQRNLDGNSLGIS
jgi:hypothetical protein